MKTMMDEVLEQEEELIRVVREMQKREGELIGLVKDMRDREKRVGNLLLKIAQRLNDLEARIEILEGQNNE